MAPDSFSDLIEHMLELEVNYEDEARHMEHARGALKDLQDVVIPALIPKFCTKRVLTMEYLEGQHLEEFMQTEPRQLHLPPRWTPGLD